MLELQQLEEKFDSKKILDELNLCHFRKDNIWFISSQDGKTYSPLGHDHIRANRNINQNEHDKLNELFKGTYIGQIYNELNKKYDICLARYMKLYSKKCYTYHRDLSMRIHIPVVTNENCGFIVNDKFFRMPDEGQTYLLDTTQKHSALNMSTKDRIHLVFCLKK